MEEKVIKSLLSYGVDFSNENLKNNGIGIAVSGGADSVSLLICLINIFTPLNIFVHAITINHLIRPENESNEDENFVIQLCNNLQKKNKLVTITNVKLKSGEVQKVAQKRKNGIEEAARFLRYNRFEKFIKEKKIDFFCTAHNKNDNLETLLMRFLQGSFVENQCGIQKKRKKIIRPLIDISRTQIEQYLKSQQIEWKTDKTNFDTNYLRNKIRLKLIPLLNEEFSGWEKAIQNGSEKNYFDSKIIDEYMTRKENEILTRNDDFVSFKLDDFLLQNEGTRIRLLYKAIFLLNVKKRVSFDFIKDVLKSINKCSKKTGNALLLIKTFSNIEIYVKNQTIFIKNQNKKFIHSYFFDIIEKIGNYNFSFENQFFLVQVKKNESNDYSVCVNNTKMIKKIDLPFCIRNYQQGDKIKIEKKSKKSQYLVFMELKGEQKIKLQLKTE